MLLLNQRRVENVNVSAMYVLGMLLPLKLDFQETIIFT